MHGERLHEVEREEVLRLARLRGVREVLRVLATASDSALGLARVDLGRVADEEYEARCSFCRKKREQVASLIAGVGVSICNECMDLCNEILGSETGARRHLQPSPRSYSSKPRPPHRLLKKRARRAQLPVPRARSPRG